MAADPNDFAYFKNAEPLPALKGVSSTVAFDYFKNGEPIPALITVTTTPAATVRVRLLPLTGIG